VTQGPSAGLRFRVLGPVRAYVDGVELDLGAGKQRAVLATLLLSLGRPVPVAQIVDAVWGDRPPENGANVVQKYVAGLRRALEPDRSARAPGQLIALTEGGYVLTAPPDTVDAEIFERDVRDAEAALPTERRAHAGELLGRALTTWQAPLAGLTGAFFDAARERLGERRAHALELSAELALAEGRATAAVTDLASYVAEYPLRERLRYLLILALYRAGRQPEALAAYRDAREFVVEEFGVEPGPALQELHQRILRGDADLAGPPTPPPPPPAPAPALPASFSPSPSTYPSYASLAYPQAGFAPAQNTRTGLRTTASVAAGVLSTCSVGFLTWALVGLFAIHRRSKWLALATVGYLAVILFSLVAAVATPEEVLDQPGADAMDLAMGLWVVAWFIGIVQVTTLTATDNFWTAKPSDNPVVALDWHRHQLREQARRIIQEQPGIARELRIGRPDLTRHFDDGGLVDINAVNAGVLGVLPGLSPQVASVIVADRAARGPFAAPADLVGRGLVPPHVLHHLQDTLIALPS
jgi:SARP family transcriptional regulator, regulator of embCAB operon